MTTIRKAGERDIRTLSRIFLHFLEDKNGRFYQENVAKFCIPDEYVKEALDKETLLKAMSSGRATFCVAVENNAIVGFAQIIHQDGQVTELDRIVVFPLHERKGSGTKLLHRAIVD